jgi:ribose transport system substrate-binding protein
MVVQPASATGALQALQSSGRPIVPISVGGEMGALCYWTQNPDWVDESFNVWPPGNEMQAGFEIGVRTLMGQGPKIQSIVRGLPPLTFEQAKEAVGPDCDINNNGWYQPPANQWFSNEMLNGFFEAPANPLG